MKRVVAAALLALSAIACSKKAEEPAKVAATATPVKQLDPATLPPGHPPVSAAQAQQVAPQSAQRAPAAAAAAGTLTGKVLETMNSGGYTYIKLRTDSGDLWAAVQQT